MVCIGCLVSNVASATFRVIPGFPLMPNCSYQYPIFVLVITVQHDVAGAATGNYQFSPRFSGRSPDQRMLCKNRDGVADQQDGFIGHDHIRTGEEIPQPFEIVQCSRQVEDRRHAR